LTNLIWPLENAQGELTTQQQWFHAGSNICLDFHGDPLHAELIVYSDGNHHMALQQAVQKFLSLKTDINDIFYATTPPGVLVDALHNNGLVLGNLKISVMPNVFIGPENILSQLVEHQFCNDYSLFIKSQGNVALVRKGNPLKINTSKDLLRDDVCLFLSNPMNEKASYQVYYEFLLNSGLTPQQLIQINTYHGQKIHHREAPQALLDNLAQVVIVYYHLALRYCRIFPDQFEIVELLPLRHDLNPVTNYAIGVIADGGVYGQAFSEFMQSEAVKSIYEHHGLQKL
jgi:accessory colonization factor AcfC